jgi:hypothetical protein
VQATFDFPVRQPIGTAEDNPGSKDQTLGQGAFANHRLQPFSISRTQQ